jgi:formylglycine-generating enzyme
MGVRARVPVVLVCSALVVGALTGPACRPAPAPSGGGERPGGGEGAGEASPAEGAEPARAETSEGGAASGPEPKADAAPPPRSDPMDLHRNSREELLSLVTLKDFTEKERAVMKPDAFLARVVGTDGPHQMNQGNKEIAQHTKSREECLEGLKDVVIQTEEQRRVCGAENMVPVWAKGKDPTFCIDVFEFPNKTCELPWVWTAPAQAKRVCELQGKRLCADTEWNLACRADPEGGPDRRYAYGDELDLDICHTNLRHRERCVSQSAQTGWKTCTTDTEPSGSFPQCRSRFGVFDQHGNVAEVMTRKTPERVVTQLKGSAWFYVELAKEPGGPPLETTTLKKAAYPDHCNFDPRWHVETLEKAQHVNYHLGFRCCKSIP